MGALIPLAAWLALAPRPVQAKESELGIPLLPPWQDPSLAPADQGKAKGEAVWEGNAADDQTRIRAYREGLSRLLSQARGRPEIFHPSQPREFLLPEYRDIARGIWISALDYWMALESAQRRSRRVPPLAKAAARARSEFATRWTRMVGDDPLLEKLFDGEIPELGLAAGSYSAVKRAALGKTADRALSRGNAASGRRWDAAAPLFPTSSEARPLPPLARLEREFPLAKEDLSVLSELLEPGDIVLSRRELYLDDIGSPGFWQHAALYAGSGEVFECGARGCLEAPLAIEARADFLAALRPRLSGADKSDAIGRALVLAREQAASRIRAAADMVRRAYGPALGEWSSANDLARRFDSEFGTQSQRLDFVLFWGPLARRSTLEDFRRSWRRPKWTHQDRAKGE